MSMPNLMDPKASITYLRVCEKNKVWFCNSTFDFINKINFFVTFLVEPHTEHIMWLKLIYFHPFF